MVVQRPNAKRELDIASRIFFRCSLSQARGAAGFRFGPCRPSDPSTATCQADPRSGNERK
jgi:hypothetical protein